MLVAVFGALHDKTYVNVTTYNQSDHFVGSYGPGMGDVTGRCKKCVEERQDATLQKA